MNELKKIELWTKIILETTMVKIPKSCCLGYSEAITTRERERDIEREIGQTASQRGMDGCNIEEFPVIWRFNLIQAMYTESKFTIKLVGAIKGWIVYRSITTLSQSTSEVIYKLISYAVSYLIWCWYIILLKTILNSWFFVLFCKFSIPTIFLCK